MRENDDTNAATSARGRFWNKMRRRPKKALSLLDVLCDRFRLSRKEAVCAFTFLCIVHAYLLLYY